MPPESEVLGTGTDIQDAGLTPKVTRMDISFPKNCFKNGIGKNITLDNRKMNVTSTT